MYFVLKLSYNISKLGNISYGQPEVSFLHSKGTLGLQLCSRTQSNPVITDLISAEIQICSLSRFLQVTIPGWMSAAGRRPVTEQQSTNFQTSTSQLSNLKLHFQGTCMHRFFHFEAEIFTSFLVVKRKGIQRERQMPHPVHTQCLPTKKCRFLHLQKNCRFQKNAGEQFPGSTQLGHPRDCTGKKIGKFLSISS